jgi:DNA-binding transcriptional ArsR family regulator
MINVTALEKIRSREKIVELSMILGQLWNREMYVGEIKRRLGLSYPLTSRYLALLKKARIIRIERTKEARGQPRKYYKANIEAIVDFLAEKSNLSSDEKRILLRDAFSASKAINVAPSPSDIMQPESINQRLILTYPFVIVGFLDFLYGEEPDVQYLQKVGLNGSDIRSLQAVHRRSIKCFPFPPPPKLSNGERDWFKNKENRRLRDKVLMKILPCKDPELTPLLELLSKLEDRRDDQTERIIDIFAKFRALATSIEKTKKPLDRTKQTAPQTAYDAARATGMPISFRLRECFS